MTPIHCLAIDDEPLALQQLGTYIQKVPYLSLAASCCCATDAIEVLNSQTIDALFVDINMPDINGLDFVRSLHQPPLIVFVTAYAEHAIDGFQVNALDYLLKPFGMTDFLRTAEKVKQQYTLLHSATLSPVDRDQAIFLKTEYRVVRVRIPDIVFIEGMAEYVRIHTTRQPKPITTFLSMKKLEDQLHESEFMRIHKSYIINLRCIAEINRNRVILEDGTELPIGDSYRDSLNNYVNQKFLGR